ncbi:MAG: hypothetical protein ACI80V_001198 [Rhodothermales bacterium]|jgi:hypothetical protein
MMDFFQRRDHARNARPVGPGHLIDKRIAGFFVEVQNHLCHGVLRPVGMAADPLPQTGGVG